MQRGTGKMSVKNDGRIYYFCSSKCEKNLMKLSRTARRTRWTEEARAYKKEIASEKAKEEAAPKKEKGDAP